jgi:hypothetical protein
VIRNQVVLAPVVVAVPVAAGCHEPFVAAVGLTSEKLVPSALEYIYTLLLLFAAH